MKIPFRWQNYNEYNHGVRFHDYIGIIVNQFPIILIRKFDNPHYSDDNGFIVFQFIGFDILSINLDKNKMMWFQ